MKLLNKVLLITLTLLLMLPITANALSKTYKDNLYEILNKPKEENKINIYFFHGDGCPHCKHEREFLEELEEKYGEYYNLYSFETWASEENKSLMLKAKEALGTSQNIAVPFTVIGDEYFTGYDESVGKDIELTLKKYADIINEDEYIVEKNKKNIPLIGEVDIRDVSIGFVAVILGLVDGFNPCAMWVLLFLINMLIGMNDRKKMLIIGFVFLFTSAFMYFLFMLGITNILSYISVPLIRRIIGIIALVVGGYNVYRFFRDRNKDEGCHVVDESKRKKIFKRIKKFTQEKNLLLALGGVIILAISVNVVELACSSVFPATFAEILAVNNVTGVMKIIYLLIYTLFYMIDDLIVFTIAVATLQLSTASSKYGKYSSIVGGIIMLLVGILLLLKPEWLMLNF